MLAHGLGAAETQRAPPPHPAAGPWHQPVRPPAARAKPRLMIRMVGVQCPALSLEAGSSPLLVKNPGRKTVLTPFSCAASWSDAFTAMSGFSFL